LLAAASATLGISRSRIRRDAASNVEWDEGFHPQP
jgi:hypothetical protein